MRLFASNIKKLQQERIGVPSCVWTGEGLTLQRLLRITAPIIALSWLRTIHRDNHPASTIQLFRLLDECHITSCSLAEISVDSAVRVRRSLVRKLYREQEAAHPP